MRQSTLSFLFLGLCLGLSFGWWSGRQQMAAQRMDIREELFQAMSDNRALTQVCFDNMTNQFTPGYKFTQVLLDPNNPTLSMEQGKVFRTQTSTHLAVNGAGLFVLSHDGETRYTRDGRFTFQDGTLKNEDKSVVLGYIIDAAGKLSQAPQAINLPLDPRTKLYGGLYVSVHFNEEGVLFGRVSDGSDTPLFKVALAGFERPERLARAGVTSFRATDEANLIREGVAGQWDLGAVAPGSLELSNVDFMEQGITIGALRQQAGLLHGDPMPGAPRHQCQAASGQSFSFPSSSPGAMMANPYKPPASSSLPGMDPLMMMDPLTLESGSTTKPVPKQSGGMFSTMSR